MTDHVLTSPLEQARGVIGRYPDPDERYIFDFDSVDWRQIHMLGVRRPLLVEWYDGETLVHSTILEPWWDSESHLADRVIERRPRD